MVWYVLLRSLRPELDGQMSFKFMGPRLPTIITRTLSKVVHTYSVERGWSGANGYTPYTENSTAVSNQICLIN
jgi:hypothetical protein